MAVDAASYESPAISGIRSSSRTPLARVAPVGDWRRRLSRRLWISDLTVLIVVVYGTQFVWFGFGPEPVVTRTALPAPTYWVVSAVLVTVWMWALALTDTRAPNLVGTGNLEYLRVASASLRLFGVIAIVAFVTRFDLARGYLLLALPAGVVLLELSRWQWSHWLRRQRAQGRYAARALLVGSRTSVGDVAAELHRHRGSAYRVVGACLPSGAHVGVPGVPVLGDADDIAAAIAECQADTVIITSTDDLPAAKVKQISWQLEAGRQHLVLAPSIMDIAGPRIHTRPVAGLPLIHVETPRFSRGQRLGKRLFDMLLSVLLLVVLSPLLLMLAIAVRMSSPGPVIFRQERVGQSGELFRIVKFRSMVDGAEERLHEVAAGQDAGNTVLFKRSDDPRVTPLGRWMRRHSLDELPQLLNVLGGSMSLVGPRPPLPREVGAYDDHVHRRFLMKPGMTGAWQVGGRSSLSWEESVRLDLGYVENWSLLGDLGILLRTMRAVVAPDSTVA